MFVINNSNKTMNQNPENKDVPDEIVEEQIEQMKFEKVLVQDVNDSIMGSEHFEEFLEKLQKKQPDMSVGDAQEYWAEEMETQGTKWSEEHS